MPGLRCAVYGCNNSRVVTKVRNPDVAYHCFPKAKDICSQMVLKEWINCCKRADKFNSRTSVICSVHFTHDHYKRDLRNELLGLPLRRILKKNAIPTLYLPGKTNEMDTTSDRQDRYIKEESIELEEPLLVEETCENILLEQTTLPDNELQPITFTSDLKQHVQVKQMPSNPKRKSTDESCRTLKKVKNIVS